MFRHENEFDRIDVNITTLLQGWADGSYPNHGIKLIFWGPDSGTGETEMAREIFYNSDSLTYYPRIKINVSWQVFPQAVGGATLTPTGGITTKKAKKGVGGALIFPEGTLSDGRTENAADVPYEFIIGPTTLGINTREKRLRRIFLIVSKEASATMYVSVAMNESGSFGTEVEIAPGEQLSMVKKYIPLAVGEAANGMVLRIKVRGAGEITVHDAGAELSIREG